jgi:isopentenyl diphosphate isomerase/L-lactate dehydrogenase-like FMN-dependent dehydrogenase
MVPRVMSDRVNVADFERDAAQRLEPGAFGYFAGGAGDEWTLRENVRAFERWCLRPRVLVDIGSSSAATTVLGTEVSMPLLVAPVALQRLAHPDGEPAMAAAAVRAGTIFCLSTLATSRPAEVAAQAPAGPRWFQAYVLRDRAVTDALIDEAVAQGFGALLLTVDAPRAGRRERDLRTGFTVPADVDMPAVRAAVGGPSCPTPAEFFALVDDTLTWSDIGELIERAPLPVVLKGIQTAEDARLACEHGAAALVVSNHGGRQLDGVAASLDILPEVVDAVEGRLEVLMDGGVRRGSDVVRALALGARAVLAGRAPLWGLAIDGEQGALSVLELLRDEIELSLALLGARTPAEVTGAHVARAAAC